MPPVDLLFVDTHDEYFVRIDSGLITRKAGTGAREQADAERRRALVVTALARLLRAHTAERAWRRGAEGEERVAKRLKELPEWWYAFHDLPIGSDGANVDHLVVGAGGVFSINTKNLSGKVWLAERALLVAGHKTDYLAKARREAERVARQLRRPLGRELNVRPIIALICPELAVKARPPDVTVVRSHKLVGWLTGQPTTLSVPEVLEIARIADRPATWGSGKTQLR
jgi:hypothetical protein